MRREKLERKIPPELKCFYKVSCREKDYYIHFLTREVALIKHGKHDFKICRRNCKNVKFIKYTDVKVFFDNMMHDEDDNSIAIKYPSDYSFSLDLIRIGFRLIKNAEILMPLREAPLIIRNENYTMYIAPKIIEEIYKNK